MKNAIAPSKIDRILLFCSSIYLIVTSLISIWLIFIIIQAADELKFLIVLSLIASAFTIGLTLWTNSVILSKIDSLRKKDINVNLIICLVQSFSLFMNCFRFKYVQGLECMVFVYTDQAVSKFKLGFLFPRTGFEFVFNFMYTTGVFFSVNLFALTFLLFFIYISKKYFKNAITSL